jgi:hypothetical protein
MGWGATQVSSIKSIKFSEKNTWFLYNNRPMAYRLWNCAKQVWLLLLIVYLIIQLMNLIGIIWFALALVRIQWILSQFWVDRLTFGHFISEFQSVCVRRRIPIGPENFQWRCCCWDHVKEPWMRNKRSTFNFYPIISLLCLVSSECWFTAHYSDHCYCFNYNF